jgi:mono/diheme cytochrome c family protein
MLPDANEKPHVRMGVLRVLPPVVLWSGFLYLLFFVPPDGREHGNLGQFFGRFHMLLVHGPIVLLLLVPILELAGRRPGLAHLRAAAGVLLSLAALLTFFTALDGWLLAWSGGYRGNDITRHMWAGAWLAALCGTAARTRCPDVPRGVYPVFLTLAVVMVVITGHTGGKITHGGGYLTDRMPARVRLLLGMPAAVPAPAAAAGIPAPVHGGPGSTDPANPAYYAVHIAPLFTRSCISCHRPQKHKGGFMLDTYDHLMHGGEDGPAIVPGNSRGSELLRRVRLPASDDDSMPSDGDKPLTQEEIQMVERWITAGARRG